MHRKLNQLGINLDDLVDHHGAFKFVCYPKDAYELDDPVSCIDWNFLDGKISGDRIEALEAGAEPIDRETQLLRHELVRHRLQEPDADFMPGVFFCSLPDESGPQVR